MPEERPVNQMHTDAEMAQAAREQLIPFILLLYEHARLDVPMLFRHEDEAARVISTLRAQGFTAKFSTRSGEVLK